MPRESEIISAIRRRAERSQRVRIGIGDDAAVTKLPSGSELLACCDLMVEDVHFCFDWTTPRLLGRKALAVNLSDIAAMGGVPAFAMSSVALSDKCDMKFITELFDGMLEEANHHGVAIIGGDTSRSLGSIFIDVSVIGHCAEGKAVTRSGAKPGDSIFVSGCLGEAALGLRLLQLGVRLDELDDEPIMQSALLKHLSPAPRTELGKALGESGMVNAMIDISDGLSVDLAHIAEESSCSAVIHSDAIPVVQILQHLRLELDIPDVVDFAVGSGEEYELLFTVAPANAYKISSIAEKVGVPITRIGEIGEGKGVQIEDDGVLSPLPASGYEHLI